MRNRRRSSCCGLFLSVALAAWPATAAVWQRETVVAGINGAPPGISPHGLTGIAAAGDGTLLAGSVIGPGIYRFDPKAGTVAEEIEPAAGEADDVAVGDDGTLVWTALLAGELRIRRPGALPTVLAKDLPLVNPVAFAEGRLYAGQIGTHDTLLDVDAKTGAHRVLARGLGGINAFVADGAGGLFVPLAAKGAIGRFDLGTGELKIIAEGLGQPVAVKRDSQGGLFTIDWRTGRVIFVHPQSGETKKIATVAPPLDNLAIGADDTIYVTRPVDNSIVAVDPATGAQRIVFQGRLAAPGGLALTTVAGKPSLLVADAYGYRTVDLASGAVVTPPFDPPANAGSMIAATDKIIAFTNVRRGSLVIVYRQTGRVRHALGGFKAPMSVVIESETSFLVADYGNGEIIRVHPGAAIERVTVFGGLRGPVGLARRANGELLVTEADEGTLVALDAETGGRRILAANLLQPEGLALMPDGRVAVAEVGARRLIAYDPAGLALKPEIEIIAEDLQVGAMFTAAPAPVYLPTGVAVDAVGAIYVTCDRDNTVLKFSLK